MRRIVDGCNMALSYIEVEVSPPLENCLFVPIISINTTTDIQIGDTSVSINDPLIENTKADTTFYTEDEDLIITIDGDQFEGSNTIDIYPALDFIPAGTRLISTHSQRVHSVSLVTSEVEDVEINDRVFGESIWTTSKIASRKIKLSIKGTLIKNDLGLNFVTDSIFQNKPFYLRTFKDTSILPNRGYAYALGYKKTKGNDTNIEVNFDLIFVSLNEIKYSETVYLIDEDDNYITDEDGNSILCN